VFQQCQPGTVTRVPAAGLGSSCAVWIAQPPQDAGGWVLDLFAFLAGKARYHVRSARVAPVAPGRFGGRVIMVETVPGADSWQLVVTSPSPPPASALGVLLTSVDDVGAAGRLSGPAGVYRHSAGIGPATVDVPAGAVVQHWSAVAVGADGTVTIGTEPLITIRAGAAFDDSPLGLVGPVSIVFAGGIDARLVSWLEV